MVLVIWGVCKSFGLDLTPISLLRLSLPTLFYGSWLRSWLLTLLTSWLLALTIGCACRQITGCNLTGSPDSRSRILALVEGHGADPGLLGLSINGWTERWRVGENATEETIWKCSQMFNEKIQLLNTKYLWGSRGRLESGTFYSSFWLKRTIGLLEKSWCIFLCFSFQNCMMIFPTTQYVMIKDVQSNARFCSQKTFNWFCMGCVKWLNKFEFILKTANFC